MDYYLFKDVSKRSIHLAENNINTLKNLRGNFGQYDGQKEKFFELNGKERKVFNVLNYGSGEETFDLSFVD